MLRRPMALGLVSLAGLAAAGCGSDDKKTSSNSRSTTTEKPEIAGGAAGATAFTRCFKQAGFVAKVPPKGQESTFAAIARSKGYNVTAINISKPGMLSPNALFVWFDDPQTATKASKELKVNTISGPAPVQRGPVVYAYFGDEDQRLIGAAVDRCLPR